MLSLLKKFTAFFRKMAQEANSLPKCSSKVRDVLIQELSGKCFGGMINLGCYFLLLKYSKIPSKPEPPNPTKI